MRQYLIGSWANADEYDYSGEQLMGNRLGASREVPHFTASGKANVAKYGDNTEKKGPSISIKDRILPQFKRLQTLRTQMLDLEKEYKTTDMACEEYSILRDVIVCKIERAEVLYKKAISVRPIRSETDEDSAQVQVEYTPSRGFRPQPNDRYASEEYDDCGVRFIDELSEQNSLKGVLKFSCKAIRKAVQFSQATRNYIKTLSEV